MAYGFISTSEQTVFLRHDQGTGSSITALYSFTKQRGTSLQPRTFQYRLSEKVLPPCYESRQPRSRGKQFHAQPFVDKSAKWQLVEQIQVKMLRKIWSLSMKLSMLQILRDRRLDSYWRYQRSMDIVPEVTRSPHRGQRPYSRSAEIDQRRWGCSKTLCLPRGGPLKALQHLLYARKDLLLIAKTSFGKSMIS